MSEHANYGGTQYNAPRGVQNFFSKGTLPVEDASPSNRADAVRNNYYLGNAEARSLEKVVDALHEELAKKGEKIDQLDSEIRDLRIKMGLLERDSEALSQALAIVCVTLGIQTLDLKGYVRLSIQYLFEDKERFSKFLVEQAGK